MLEPMKTLAKKVAELRQKKGWTQGELAAAVGVSQGSIGNIESGIRPNPRAATVLGIAKALGVSAQWLQSGEGDMLPRGMESTSSVGGGLSVASTAPDLAQALEVVAHSLSQVPADKRQALLGVLAAYAARPSEEANSLTYLQSELEKTVAPQGIHPSAIATGRPPGGPD